MGDKSGIHLDSIIAPAPLSTEDTRRAQVIVADNSMGVEDCRMLLDTLGLNSSVDNNSGA